MAPSPSPTTSEEDNPPNPSKVIAQNLRNAERINASAHRINASSVAGNAKLFIDFLKSALINLDTNAIIFDAVIPNVPVEEAFRWASLRVANETALVGIRAIQLADKKARAAARRADKETAKQTIIDTDPLQTFTNTNATPTTLHPPSVRLTKAGFPKKKTGPKPGSHRMPKAEKLKPTAAETEQQQARGVGQPEALALLAEHFASSPVRQLSPSKRKASGKEVDGPAADRKEGKTQEARSKAEARTIKKMKRMRFSQDTPVEEEALEPAALVKEEPEEPEETHTSPKKKQKKLKKHKTSSDKRKEKRGSDISMKDVTPITSPVSMPIPTSTSKSQKDRGRFAAKFHPYKKPGEYSKNKDRQEEVEEVGNEEHHESEDITAEVDKKMRQHRARVRKEERARELGINPGEKHKRESLEMGGPSPDGRGSTEYSSASAKKRRTKKSKEMGEIRFTGVVGDLEKKRKFSSSGLNGGRLSVERKGGTQEKIEEKAKKPQ
ncbi:hypothetical protein FKW77_004975 [Venturia effusa]|uniref:Uncharacterized protein n=1 Tax=Venturia effusa TaxID=50376 RepID=A0A517LK54_9PEZI|nr:hypothetical protein FKW77_004975 [Venturia effusa]